MLKRFSTAARAGLAFLAIPALLFGCGPGDGGAAPSSEELAGSVAADTAMTEPAYRNVTPHEAASLIPSRDYHVVNVHIPFEGEIAGTDTHIPFDEIDAHLAELPDDRDAGIVLYCRSGRMSTIAAETLASMGYTNLVHLDGGMLAWEAAGFPLEGTRAGNGPR
jgi:phage shock protein E